MLSSYKYYNYIILTVKLILINLMKYYDTVYNPFNLYFDNKILYLYYLVFVL